MFRILLLIAIVILIGLAVSRWVIPFFYGIVRRDARKIKRGISDVDEALGVDSVKKRVAKKKKQHYAK